MIPIERAVQIVRSVAADKRRPDRMPPEPVPLADSFSRILREDVLADSDSPPFDKSIRDGFAVRHEDVAAAPVVLRVIGESRAGSGAAVEITPGTCCEIMTGAPLPSGANAVVMVEHTERPGSAEVRILEPVAEGTGLMRRAAEVRRGERILESGRRIGLADIGLLAAVGKAEVLVSAKPRVAILATGDELVEVREVPGPGQIRNSNTYTLAVQAAAAGAQPVILGIARDNRQDLERLIAQGLEHDILLVSGGVSMGKYDLVEGVFADFGVKAEFDAVSMKPGKPTVFGHRGDTFVFGLPGNPVSTIVAFHMYVRPLIMDLLQVRGGTEPALKARLEVATRKDRHRTAIVPALLSFADGEYRIRTAPWKGSSDVAGLARSNALVVIPSGEGNLEADEWVDFLSLE